MKTKLITKLKKELLLVEFPRLSNYTLGSRGLFVEDLETKENHIFKGSYTLLGKPNEIKEDDVVDLCDRIGINNPLADCDFFAHYGNDETMFETALESFFSALESDIFWDVNPIKIIPRGEASEHERVENQNRFQEAETRTFDRTRTLIFVEN